MNVYCQRTNLNERLCSLLSAVWMRSIRPSHTSAIVHKGRIIIKSQDNGHLQPLGIILVGKQTQIPFHLASLTKMFGRQYSLEVTTVFTLKESAKTSTTTTTMAAYKQLENTVQNFTKQNIPFLLVALDTDGMDLVQQYLSNIFLYSNHDDTTNTTTAAAAAANSTTTTTTTADTISPTFSPNCQYRQLTWNMFYRTQKLLLGVVTRIPSTTTTTTMNALGDKNERSFSPSFLSICSKPQLWILPFGSMTQEEEKSFLLQEYYYYYITNPFSILVEHTNNTINYNNNNDNNNNNGNHYNQYDHYTVWLARCLAKYTEALAILSPQDRFTLPSSTITSSSASSSSSSLLPMARL